MEAEPPREIARRLPRRPGVYLFRDAAERVLYVGKAASLRARVGQYFQDAQSRANPRLSRLLPRIARIDTVVTSNEVEALILETELIKQHQPLYNVRMADDKAYPYIKLTPEPYPRIVMTRKVLRDGGRYFGPYPYHEPKLVGRTIRTMRRLFRLRTCRIEIRRDLERPCLDFGIGLCSAPCVAWGASPEEYSEQAARAALFLEGRRGDLLGKLRGEMQAAAGSMEFERAAVLRDQIQALEAIGEPQRVATARLEDRDVAAIAVGGEAACAELITIRAGRIQDQQHFLLSGVGGLEPGEILSQVLARHYAEASQPPGEIICGEEMPDQALLEEWLSDRRGRRVEVIVPKRGERRRLVELARENAGLYLEQARARAAGPAGLGVAELAEALRLEAPPFRIEGYDVSHFRAGEAVGAMVVFEGGRPQRSAYRQFRMRSSGGGDDYAMLGEVLRRRFGRARAEQERLDAGEVVPPRWSVLPDLILIDGGRGQLGVALEVLFEGNVAVQAAAMAKAQEEVFMASRPDPLRLPPDSRALHLLQRVRDEAHRFASGAGQRLRERRIVFSELEEIPGVGERRKRDLIRRFGSVRGVRAASPEALAEVVGAALARRIAAHLAARPLPEAPGGVEDRREKGGEGPA